MTCKPENYFSNFAKTENYKKWITPRVTFANMDWRARGLFHEEGHLHLFCMLLSQTHMSSQQLRGCVTWFWSLYVLLNHLTNSDSWHALTKQTAYKTLCSFNSAWIWWWFTLPCQWLSWSIVLIFDFGQTGVKRTFWHTLCQKSQ